MASAPDLTNPLIVDMSAFAEEGAGPTLRTDLQVPFGDGVYRFHLRDAQMMHIERRVTIMPHRIGDMVFGGLAPPMGEPIGAGQVYSRLCQGRALFQNGAPIWAGVGTCDPGASTFFRQDIDLIIGWGLVGGGEGVVKRKPVTVDMEAARDLMERYVIDRPLAPLWTLAFAIMGTRLFGRQADPADA